MGKKMKIFLLLLLGVELPSLLLGWIGGTLEIAMGNETGFSGVIVALVIVTIMVTIAIISTYLINDRVKM